MSRRNLVPFISETAKFFDHRRKVPDMFSMKEGVFYQDFKTDRRARREFARFRFV